MDRPANRRPRERRPALYCAVAGAVLLAALGAWIVLDRTPAASAPVAPESPPAPPAHPEPPPPAPAPVSRVLQGTVLDAERQAPLRGASVWAGPTEVQTDADGRLVVEAPAEPAATLVVKAPGYEMKRVAADGNALTVSLRPRTVRAAYLTYYGIAEPRIRDRVLELVGRTELNAVVIDVKGDRGLIPYRTQVAAAVDAGALGPVIMKDFDALLQSLRD